MAAFDWIQYLVLARELGARGDESALRSAVSRAYYAAYNAAEAYCSKNNIQIFKVKKSHEDLWNAFLRDGSVILRTVHDKGDRLRRKRTQADYYSEVSGLASMAEQSLEESHDILRSLGLPSPPP
jgi:uncharacterized protein (UPF0332 family)